MRRFMASMQHDAAEAFNDRVGTLLAVKPGRIVKTRVKKIGKIRI